MFAIIVFMDLATAVAATSVAVDAVATVCVDGCDATTLRSELARMKQVQSKVDAQLARLTHAADAAGAFIGTGARDTAEWLAKETGTSTRKNRSASELGEAMTKSPDLADAVTSGTISSDKAAVVVGAAGDETVDADLLNTVAGLPLNAVKPEVEKWRARNHPERDSDVAAVQRSRRYLRVTDQSDGMTRVEGLLDPESGAVVRSALDGIMNLSHDDNTNRTRDQRCADALTQIAHACSKGKIKGGRSNTKLLATVPFNTIVERASARGVTHTGNTLDAATVRKLACDAGIHRVITGPRSSILDFGHETRLVPDNLFWALVARDQFCRWPGCTIRATWCDAHHIIEWTDNGNTSEEDCALVCHAHHQLSHQPGWKLTGNGHEFTIHHPDGSVEVSKPPGAGTPRADTIGREPVSVDAPTLGSQRRPGNMPSGEPQPSPVRNLRDVPPHTPVTGDVAQSVAAEPDQLTLV